MPDQGKLSYLERQYTELTNELIGHFNTNSNVIASFFTCNSLKDVRKLYPHFRNSDMYSLIRDRYFGVRRLPQKILELEITEGAISAEVSKSVLKIIEQLIEYVKKEI